MSLPRHFLTLLCSTAFLFVAVDSYAEDDGVQGAKPVHDYKLNPTNTEDTWRGRRKGPSPSQVFNAATEQCFAKFYKPTPGGDRKPQTVSPKPEEVSDLKKEKSEALETCLLQAVAKISLQTRKANVSCQCNPVILDSTNIPGDGVINLK